ncbi:ParB/RepB/Spo0J family partition protein [Deinococcus hopiensis]|uniref:Chromosome partitioning protein, ParB family n=1 Tax=Deinococcus hopiensis KR-140 TaxID=695939 RepID=A0A1W1U9S7_9DEIO|nr:ParB/RepB/Spo0J family partition protein [Deinococcus hopiensis]SMB77800.1 chromosome partitioning protein, ParB family [Deinococcus hopiensis KR-140]
MTRRHTATVLPGVPRGAALDALGGVEQAAAIHVMPNLVQPQPGFNPRGRYLRPGQDPFSPEALADLTASIREHGVLTPLLVRPRPGGYWIVAGERRWRAFEAARALDAQEGLPERSGLRTLPVVVRSLSDVEAEELALIENGQREDLDLVQETLLGFDLLARHTGLPRDELPAYLTRARNYPERDEFGVADLLRRTFGTGLSVWVQQRSKILRLTSEERMAVQTGRLDAKVAYQLLALPEGAERQGVLRAAVEEHLTSALVRERVQRVLGVARSEAHAEAEGLRRMLGRVDRLSDDRAIQARELMQQLRALLEEDSPRKARR